MKKLSLMVAMLVVLSCICAPVFAGESKYATSANATAAWLVIGPHVGQTKVVELATSCDVALGVVNIYARGGSGRTPVTATNLSTTSIIQCANASYGLNTNDLVVYVYANGSTPVYRTLSDVTTTNVTLSSAITAPVVGDAIYEVTLQGKVVVADSTAGAGTNKLADVQNVFISPSDSPLYVTLSSATNTCLSVTVE